MKRKKTGRLNDEFEQSRYYSYSQHYVCVSCRKMFNQVDWQHWHNTDAPKKQSYPCPECGREMRAAGRDFKPPRQRNIRQWRKVDLLLQRGYRWAQWCEHRDVIKGSRYGWSYYETISGGPRARTLREAKTDYPPKE